jgi:hypothetical protein
MTEEQQADENHRHRMRQAIAIHNEFKDSPAWKPYTDGENAYVATVDPYTNANYKEPELLRWSIYWGVMPKDLSNPVRLYHDREDGGRYYEPIQEAQEALDRRARARGWQVIPRPSPKTPEPPQPKQGELDL